MLKIQLELYELFDKDAKYSLIKDTKELSGTAYFEFLPGVFKDKCWNVESVYFNRESFTFIEDLLSQVVSKFDYYALTEIDNNQNELLRGLVQERLLYISSSYDDAFPHPMLSEKYYLYLTERVKQHKSEIVSMLEAFETWLRETAESYDKITILGL